MDTKELIAALDRNTKAIEESTELRKRVESRLEIMVGPKASFDYTPSRRPPVLEYQEGGSLGYPPDPWKGKVHTAAEMKEIAKRTRAAYEEALEKVGYAGHLSEEDSKFVWLWVAHAAVGQPMLFAVAGPDDGKQ